MVFNFLLILHLLLLELCSELINLLFLLVKDLVLLLIALSGILFSQICLYFSDILLVSINHLPHLVTLLLQLFYLRIVLLYSVLKSFSRFRQGQIHLIRLQL
jgi:hypothetical protein